MVPVTGPKLLNRSSTVATKFLGVGVSVRALIASPRLLQINQSLKLRVNRTLKTVRKTGAQAASAGRYWHLAAPRGTRTDH